MVCGAAAKLRSAWTGRSPVTTQARPLHQSENQIAKRAAPGRGCWKHSGAPADWSCTAPVGQHPLPLQIHVALLSQPRPQWL